MTRGVTTVTRQTTMRELEALFDNRMPIRPLKFRGAVRDGLRLFAVLYPEVPNGEGSSGGAFVTCSTTLYSASRISSTAAP